VTPEQLARAMVATVGHEMRTPLTSIRGYVETLLDGDFDAPTARRLLETVRREALRLGRLVDGMLEFSMLELSTREHSAHCNVVEQIEATIDVVAPLAAARFVTIRTHLPESAPARVDGDACVHALTNLVENAVKHGSERGTVEGFCSALPGRSSRGIGLAVVKAIAERAGGDVRVETSSLGGARFVLRFPAG
jgi:two-component system phosphate regulon sensor histidine kinase PhoR